MLASGTALVCLLCGCDAAENTDAVCPGSVAQPIFSGHSTDDYLGSTQLQQNAVVSVQFANSTEQPGQPCSGVLLTDRWVLTAKHCMPSGIVDQATVRIGENRRLAD